MFTKRNTELIIAVITAAGMIAFAYYQRHWPIPASPEAFFYAAAVICVLPVLYAVIRCKGFSRKRGLGAG